MLKKITLLSFTLLLYYFSFAQVSVVTQHNNQERTGWNDKETQLNTENVSPATFGKYFTRTVDDEIYAQPLVVSNVNIGGRTHNIVIVATVNNTIYAFDADDSSVDNAYWTINLTRSGTRPPKNTDMTPDLCNGSYHDFDGNMGIVGTPVVDTNTNTLYVVSRDVKTDGSNTFEQYLHAIDITNGQEKSGSPVYITAQVSGNGNGNVGNVITFDEQKENQRPGLLLLNGIIYIGYAGHCDWDPYHGWLLGYDATTLQQKYVYCSTPDGGEGGIWMSGAAPAADDEGNVYISTGNGTGGTATDHGESLIRLTPSGNSLNVTSYFTPDNASFLDMGDLDFGVAETMLIPNTNLVLAAAKNDSLYLTYRDNMGGYHASSNNVIQEINVGSQAHLHASFAYYKGENNAYIYTWAENTALKQFQFDEIDDTISTNNIITSAAQGPTGNNGAFLAVSSNGSVDTTAVLWASFAANGDANQSTRPGILYAFQATNVTNELWNSSLNSYDTVGNYAKFVCPTIANGKVYLATFSDQLVVYGLHASTGSCNTIDVALNKNAFTSSIQNNSTSYYPSQAFDGDQTTRWSSDDTDPQYIYVDLGTDYDICKVILNWESSYAAAYQIQVSEDASSWTTVDSISNNNSPNDTLYFNTTARYVRLYGTQRKLTCGGCGYSLYEFQVFGTITNNCTTPTNVTVDHISEDSATIKWPTTGANSYTVQYKTPAAADWTSETVTTDSANIENLSCGSDYYYRVYASCSTGNSDNSTQAAFTTSNCTNSCGPIPTRWSNADIGDVDAAGESCYDGGVFTIKGAGADIGGNADEFQFAYITLNGDGEFVAHVASLDNTNPNDKAGIMIRDSLSATSKNVFIALTSGSGAVFQDRTASSDNTAQETQSGISAPYWVKLVKTGTQYSAYASPDDVTWTPVGTTIDGTFGSDPVYLGLAVTSDDNSETATATIDNVSFAQEILPVRLTDFTATIIKQSYVDLKWTTAQEFNNDHFDVRRSNNGSHFSTIAQIPSQNGNSATPQYYETSDNSPQSGINYYRLRQVDKDGNYSYSRIITAIFPEDDQINIYPNPATKLIQLQLPGKLIHQVTIYDEMGRRVKDMTVNNQGMITINVSHLAAGSYILKIVTDKHTYSKVFVKQ